ncbi:MAG: class I SAM-dependent methyltransferase [Okeania sp. SIO2G4]|uniref:class I SAM-dependent DNA methyltransferase n=1 Tax=unclassified Okeania TaxID=2634635 RepID=UPI0013BA902B|nr:MULTISPECIES: class I SAM-dependent methyltransferase [unclassified Okeania]NEP74433.1 class I SAM-dependent methyltransferase [Okeania sp. SIO2G5]NEP95561.1 class I SAM-dependent methyltransferase [Okeania sp. SIO2F5]NEQ93274.1 class I SAM-dependent methyltransferase [Okeania sp. SIO2G4]
MKKILKQQINQYTGITKYYDLLMTAGYYDYDTQTDALAEILKSSDSVLELGVGTGLVAEKLIKKLPKIDFLGIDFTESMLVKARQRLGENVALHHKNVLTMDLERKFDAAFSNGGIWYFIDDGQTEYTFCSHLPKVENIIKSFQNVANHLNDAGYLIFSVQGVHKDYEETLSNGITYSQKILPIPHDKFDKHYIFSQDQVVLAKQTCTYQLLPETMAQLLLDECGFKFQNITSCKQYHVYQKIR